MKYGIRTPSLKRRISARTSVKRYARHNMGLKAPRGAGWVTNPKKAAYNRVYNRTSISADKLVRLSGNRKSTPRSISQKQSLPSNLNSVGISYRPAQVGGFTRLTAFLGGDVVLKAKVKISDAMRRLNSDDYQGALQLALEANQFDTNNVDAYFVLAITNNNLQQNQEAMDASTTFLEQMPTNGEMLLVYASASFNLRNYDSALEALAEMTPEAQQSLIVLKVKAMSFYNLKRYGEAVEVLKQAPLRIRNLTPALVEIHYWLARALEAQGKKKDAVKHYERISAVWFDFEDVQQRLAELR